MKNMKKGIYIAIIALLVLAFGFSAYYLGSYFWEGKKQSDRYNELASIANGTAETTAPANESTEPTVDVTKPFEPQLIRNYQELHEMNEDMVGWLRIDGTTVNYPVMQTSIDNKDYYLYRNFDKESSIFGSLYVREECDVNRPSDNVTIYGHNMKDGSMFHDLLAYDTKSTWEKNSLIFFDTIDEYHVYKIFAVFKTTAALGEGFSFHRMEDAENADEFNKWVATCKNMSFYDTGITPIYGDKIICLCTCEYTLSDGRFVVAAVRIS